MRRLLVLASSVVFCIGSAAPAKDSNPDYRKLLREGERRLYEAQTCHAEYTWKQDGGRTTRAEVFLKKPHLVHQEWSYSEDGMPTITGVQHDDGVRGIIVSGDHVLHDSRNRSVIDRTIRTTWDRSLLMGFFERDWLKDDHLPKGAKLRPMGKMLAGELICTALTVTRKDHQLYLILAAPDGSLRGFDRVLSESDGGDMYVGRLTSLALNEPIPERILNWTPPAGASAK